MTALLKTRAATLRRTILLGLAILVALLASNAAAPATADAIMIDYRVPASHVGWVYTASDAPCVGLFAACPVSRYHRAWRWSGSSWQQANIDKGVRVYVYPYSGTWHWIWTQRTGWLAIENAKLTRYQFACRYACL